MQIYSNPDREGDATNDNIKRALRILNATMPRPARRRRARQRIPTQGVIPPFNDTAWTCPVCHRNDCNLEWSEEVHSRE